MANVDLGIEGLNQYRQIGAGGFAVVYAANEEGAGRVVAVKVLHSVNEAGRRRFDRERRTMGRTTGHPNIVTMLRSGFTEPGDRPFLVMEYLDGGSLRDRLDRTGTIPLPEAIAITADIANALRFGHASGILHKDVKPANILMSASGAAKLTDFGIAAIKEATDASQIAYSMAYTAPESFAATQDPVDGTVIDPRDERSDLYSLAATLYALVTGQPPFGGPNQVSLMRQIVESEPAATGHHDLDRFLATALAKDPADRFPDAEQFSAALQGISTTGQPPPASTLRTPTPTPATMPEPTVAQTMVAPTQTSPTPTPTSPTPTSTSASATAPPPPGPAPAPPADMPPTVEPIAVRRQWSVLAAGLVIVAAIAGGALLWLRNGAGDDTADTTTTTQPTTTQVPDEDDGPEVEQEITEASATFTGHRDRADDPARDGVVAVIQLRDGRMASAGSDGSAQIWDLERPDAEPTRFTGHDEAVQALVELPDGRIASAGADGTVRLWRPDDPGTTLASYERHRTEANDPREDGVSSLILLTDGRVASASGYGTVHVWDPDTVEAPPLVFSGHRERAADEDRDGVVQVIELSSGLLASAGIDGSVQIWDPADPSLAALVYEGHSERVLAVAELPDGRLVSAGADITVRVWPPDDPRSTSATFDGHDERVLALAVLPDGRVASGGADGTVRIWDPDDPATPTISSYNLHRDQATDPDEDAVTALAVLSDGRIASASGDGSVQVWSP